MINCRRVAKKLKQKVIQRWIKRKRSEGCCFMMDLDMKHVGNYIEKIFGSTNDFRKESYTKIMQQSIKLHAAAAE